MRCKCYCDCPRQLDHMQQHRSGTCFACMAGVHPSQEFKQQQEQYSIQREMYQQQLEASKLMAINYEHTTLADKPVYKSEPCEFVFIGKVKTCGKHGILCEEL